MPIPASELILNPDGSVYHLNLLPEHISPTIITVGDPDRVDIVTSHFDTIEFTIHRREFKTVTGNFKGKRLTVISTGIGTDNIDIVLNELDALVNIDLQRREIKSDLTSLTIVRIGTSGAIQKDIPVDSLLLSKKAVGLDALLHFYDSKHVQDLEFQQAFVNHMKWSADKSIPYVVNCSSSLAEHFKSSYLIEGITATNIGFYAPQGRKLRLETSDATMNSKLGEFSFPASSADRRENKITNLEMETAGIYGLASLLGHQAISLNAILANRALGTFSKDPASTTDRLITFTLDKLVSYKE